MLAMMMQLLVYFHRQRLAAVQRAIQRSR